MKRLILKESQIMLLKEGFSDREYHFTSLDNGLKICNSDTIYLSSAYAKDSDNYDNKRKYYLSLTRVRNGNFGYSQHYPVRIEFDGSKLMERFKGKQVNYWAGDTFMNKHRYYENLPKDYNDLRKNLEFWIERLKKKNPSITNDEINRWIEYNFNETMQHHTDNESEDRLFSYEPVISDLHKYILSIDVCIENYERDKPYAFDFLIRSQLQKFIHIYDSFKEFNNPKGIDINEQVKEDYFNTEKEDRTYADKRGKFIENSRTKEGIIKTICFIAFGDPSFNGSKIREFLDKYQLSHYDNLIGDITREIKRNYFTSIIESLNSVRRDLSDKPTKDNSNVLKMLTDYLISIGARSFKDGIRIKKQMVEDYYNNGNRYAYERIDTSKKEPITVNELNYVLVLNPNVDKFIRLVGWTNEEAKMEADNLSYNIMNDDNYKTTSKNVNSLFQYLYKLFRQGSVNDVVTALKSIGFNDDELENIGVKLTVKEMDYYDAVRYNTINSYYIDDWNEKIKIRDNEIEKFFKEKQHENINN